MNRIWSIASHPGIQTVDGCYQALRTALGDLDRESQRPYLLLLCGLPFPGPKLANAFRKHLKKHAGWPNWLLREAKSVCADEFEALALGIPDGTLIFSLEHMLNISAKPDPAKEITEILIQMPSGIRLILIRYLQHRQPIPVHGNGLDRYASEVFGGSTGISGFLPGIGQSAWNMPPDELRRFWNAAHREISRYQYLPEKEEKTNCPGVVVPLGQYGHWMCFDGKSWFRAQDGKWHSTGSVPVLDTGVFDAVLCRSGNTNQVHLIQLARKAGSLVSFDSIDEHQRKMLEFFQGQLPVHVSLGQHILPGQKVKYGMIFRMDASGDMCLEPTGWKEMCGVLAYYRIEGVLLVMAISVLHEGKYVLLTQVRIHVDDAPAKAILQWGGQHETGRSGPYRLLSPGSLIKFRFRGRSENARRQCGWEFHDAEFVEWKPSEDILKTTGTSEVSSGFL